MTELFTRTVIARTEAMARTAIVVIGASAGGVEAMARLVGDLPADLPAAVFVTLHFPATVTSVMPAILSRSGPLRAHHPADGEKFHAGRIYVASPDHHLLVGPSRVRVVRGPRENGHRPAIDPLFRSAAASHGPRVIGVLLTGNLDDGTAGLLQLKRRGGAAIVQDPDEAMFRSMPQSAIENVAVDHVLPLRDIGTAIAQLAIGIASLARTTQPKEAVVHDDAERETAYDALDLATIKEVENHPGNPSQFGCPDCGGVLWEINDGTLLRYRCRVGHAWSSEALMARQAEQLDTALWMALRTLEEHVSLNATLADRARKRGHDFMVVKHERDADEARVRARTIRGFLAHREEQLSHAAPQPAHSG